MQFIARNQGKINPIANIIFLLFSCSLTVYGIIQFSDNLILEWCLGIFAVTVDVYMQYILAFGKFLWRHSFWFRAFLLFVVYAIYAIFYNFLFGVGFFMVELDVKDQVHNTENYIVDVNQRRIREINNEIELLDKYLETESVSGFGKRSEKVLDQKNTLIVERQKLLQTFQKVLNSNEKVSRNVFQVLGEYFNSVFGWPKDILKIIMFGIGIIVMQLGLILTSWNLNEPKNDKNEIVTKKDAEIEPELTSEKKEFLEFVDSIIRESGSLNGIERVSETTGIPVEKCKSYRDYLDNLIINNKPVVTKTKGARVANFSKEVISQYLYAQK